MQTLTERYINLFPKTQKGKLPPEIVKEVWTILQATYASIGGIHGCDSIDDLVNDSSMWKCVRRNGKIVAVTVYTDKRGGRKTMYGGCDGTPQGKADLYRIIDDDCTLIERLAWAEVDAKMQHIYVDKHDANLCPARAIKYLMPDKFKLGLIQFIPDDDYHYIRKIGNDWCKKAVVGNIPKDLIKNED